MENEREINTEIIRLTMKIHETHPELSKFLNELPVTIPDEKIPKINSKVLKEYYESLIAMLKIYKGEHIVHM